jgi:hypothetical protein
MFLNKYPLTVGAFFMLLFCVSQNFYSQSSGIKGVVTDVEKLPLEMVSVAILHPKDNTLLSFTSTNTKGEFYLNDISRDSIVLQINLLGFSPFSKKLVYKKQLIDLKTIVLKDDIGLLDEVIISAVVPIQIKKDTVSYNANSFKVNYDDNIEGLLKKLPGLEIDEEGKVVAQGNQVTKIFVDGKEFFGGDPSIVLKNLSADAIAKIEVIDKKSDEAELTGINDGNKEVVINFTLKKTKKNRGFGKLAAGIGLDNRYFSNLNYNQFNSKSQVSVIGKFNNINITGSNIQSFLSNSDGVTDDSDDGTESGFITPQKNLSGFLKTAVAGFHYGKELKKKESFNADYFYNSSENSGVSKTNRVFFSRSNNFNYKSENNYLNTTDNHNLNFNYENKSNKTSTLRILGKFNSDIRNSNKIREGQFFNDVEELVTLNNNESESRSYKKFGDLSINYLKRLQKKGRIFNLLLATTVNNYERESDQTTFTKRNLNNTTPTERELSINRNQDVNSNILNLKFKFTEPIIGKHYLNIEAVAFLLSGKEVTDQSRKTITTSTTEDFIDFNYKYSENNFKTKLSHNYNTTTLNIATGVELHTLDRKFGEVDVNEFNKNKRFLNPSFIFQYKPKRGRRYKFSYKKMIKAPRASQTNPFVNDINPFYINTGNTELKAQKVDSYSLFANVYDFRSSVNFNTKFQYMLYKDAIIRNVSINDDYVRAVSYQNSGNRDKFNGVINFNHKINSLGLRYSLKNSYTYNAANSVVNFDLNKVISKDYYFNFLVQNNKKRKVDLKAGFYYRINRTSFSLEENLNRKYTTQKYFGMVDFDISKRFNVNTQLDYIFYDDKSFDIHQEIPIWNAAISYSLSNNNNIVKLVFIDLLNKNVDVLRRSTQNFFEETELQSLGRYVILSYTYRLNSGKTAAKKKVRKG